MLNSFGRLLIWLGVAAFVAPLIMTAVVLTKTTFALNSAFSKLDEAALIDTSVLIENPTSEESAAQRAETCQ